LAKRLTQDGFAVVVNYLSNAAEAEEVVAELKGIGDRVRAELLRRIGLTDVLTPRDLTGQSKSAA